MKAGAQLGEAHLLFDKIEDDAIALQLQKLADRKQANALANVAAVKPAAPNVTFEDFSKLDIRAGTILTAERVAKTDKLLKLTVDTGIDQRTIVSGIAAYHTPESLPGKQVSVLVNLAPRKIKGIESQGMILMAEDLNGTLRFAAPDIAVANGSKIA